MSVVLRNKILKFIKLLNKYTRIWLAVTAIARDILLRFCLRLSMHSPQDVRVNAKCVRGPDNLYHNAATPTTQSVWSGCTLIYKSLLRQTDSNNKMNQIRIKIK